MPNNDPGLRAKVERVRDDLDSKTRGREYIHVPKILPAIAKLTAALDAAPDATPVSHSQVLLIEDAVSLPVGTKVYRPYLVFRNIDGEIVRLDIPRETLTVMLPNLFGFAAAAPYRAAPEPCPTCGGTGFRDQRIDNTLCNCEAGDEIRRLQGFAPPAAPLMCVKCGKYPAEKCNTICEFCLGISTPPAASAPEPVYSPDLDINCAQIFGYTILQLNEIIAFAKANGYEVEVQPPAAKPAETLSGFDGFVDLPDLPYPDEPPAAAPEPCLTCEGVGTITTYGSFDNHTEKPCDVCDGTGATPPAATPQEPVTLELTKLAHDMAKAAHWDNPPHPGEDAHPEGQEWWNKGVAKAKEILLDAIPNFVKVNVLATTPQVTEPTDTERLDWLMAHRGRVYKDSQGIWWIFYRADGKGERYTGTIPIADPRAAIDTAMKGGEQGE